MQKKVEQYSPGKRYRLTFSDFEEPRMMMSICRFSLTDLQTNEEIIFNPLWAIGIGQCGFSWSEDQNFVSLPIVSVTDVNRISESFFVYYIEKRQFASIHFSNCWVLDGYCHNDYIEIEYEGDQIPERIEHNKYPTKEFTQPAPLQFKFSELKWIDIEVLSQFNELNKNAVIHELKPIDNGWRPFRGELPSTTEVLIWELREFARYGDIQSQEWFAEIEAKTNNINYWVNASNYLGIKIRRQSCA
jgi:hypothetical protein